MKFNSETARLAGQKSKRGLNERTKLLNELLKPENAKKVFIELEKQALAGDMDAIKVYMAYCFGKPKESVDITSHGQGIHVIFREVMGAEPLLNGNGTVN